MSRGENALFRQERSRNSRCREKNSVICPILNGLAIANPKAWKAILMPCLHGPELSIIRGKGVPPENIVAIEKDPATWKDIRLMHQLDCGGEPLEANLAIDDISARHPGGFDLIYLDFYSRPNFSNLQMLQKIFSFRMLRPGAKLILTFGRNRSRRAVLDLNEGLLQSGEVLPTGTLVRAAAELSRHRPPRSVRNHEYRSRIGRRTIRYVTTAAQF